MQDPGNFSVFDFDENFCVVAAAGVFSLCTVPGVQRTGVARSLVVIKYLFPVNVLIASKDCLILQPEKFKYDFEKLSA